MDKVIVIGITERGLASLDEQARQALDKADAIIAGNRHLAMLGPSKAEKIAWLRPLVDTLPIIERYKHPVVVTTGDPLWFGVARRLIDHFGPKRVEVIPQISGFQYAASRLGWSLPDVARVTCHGRPIAWLSHHIAPNRRILALTDDAGSPHRIAQWLKDQPFSITQFQVLEDLGGDHEKISDYKAQTTYSSLNMVALTCAQQTAFLPPTGGIDDDCFIHDGKMTKAETRAVTLAKLKPYPHATLWDIGAGSGSISLEWLRLASYGKAIAIEPNADRRQMIEQNAQSMGGAGLEIVDGRAPQCLNGLIEPDAVFIGGGLSDAGTIDAAFSALRIGGRLVANAVTLEGEKELLQAFQKLGGDLSKIAVNRAEPVGPFHSWRPLMPVTQWSLTKEP